MLRSHTPWRPCSGSDSAAPCAGSYGSGAGSFGARSLSIAEDNEELEHDAELLLMCAAAARAQSVPASAQARTTPQLNRRASAASLEDEPSEDGREDSPSTLRRAGAAQGAPLNLLSAQAQARRLRRTWQQAWTWTSPTNWRLPWAPPTSAPCRRLRCRCRCSEQDTNKGRAAPSGGRRADAPVAQSRQSVKYNALHTTTIFRRPLGSQASHRWRR